MMQQIEELLQKFWDNQISLSELKELYLLLSVHKNELSTTADINLHQVQQEVAEKITAEKSHQILHNIHTQLGLDKQKTKAIHFYKTVTKIAVAASVIGIIFLTANLLNNKTARVTQEIVSTDNQATTNLKSFTNATAINKSIVLEDGSIIELMPGSGITYYNPFINSRRDISLTGTAFFKVAKDKNRPFTVYANGIATTALGTQFWVYANDVTHTDVLLLEGKVVVKATTGAGFVMNNVYLVPGQKLSFNRLTNQMVVNNENSRNQLEKIQDKRATNNSKQEASKGLVFDSEPIEKVLQKIEQVYKQPLSFNKSDVRGLTFTGTFLPADNLQVVLSAICIMNDLSFVNDGDSIRISKRN